MSVEGIAERKTRTDNIEARLQEAEALIAELAIFNRGVVDALEALRDQNKALTLQVISLMEQP